MSGNNATFNIYVVKEANGDNFVLKNIHDPRDTTTVSKDFFTVRRSNAIAPHYDDKDDLIDHIFPPASSSGLKVRRASPFSLKLPFTPKPNKQPKCK
jgi:hypothetical protein